MNDSDVYRIGTIGKPHGTRGEVTLRFTDDVFTRVDCPYLVLRVDGLLVPFFMDEWRLRGSESALISFEGIATMEQAQALTGCEVYFPRSAAEAAGEPASAASIVGYAIVDETTGREIGRVAAIDDATANVLLITEEGQMIPAVDEIVTQIDDKRRTISVILPDGLLEL